MYIVHRNFVCMTISYIVAVSLIGGETGVPGYNHRPVATLSHNAVLSTHRHDRDLNSQFK
jgi:hypothetical protein